MLRSSTILTPFLDMGRPSSSSRAGTGRHTDERDEELETEGDRWRIPFPNATCSYSDRVRLCVSVSTS